MLSILASSGASSAAGMGGMILWLVILFAFMYFFMIRPQKKETQKKNAMLSELATGDTVLTTSGFYGTVIDITDDTVIVEFGSNKNCRIPALSKTFFASATISGPIPSPEITPI